MSRDCGLLKLRLMAKRTAKFWLSWMILRNGKREMVWIVDAVEATFPYPEIPYQDWLVYAE